MQIPSLSLAAPYCPIMFYLKCGVQQQICSADKHSCVLYVLMVYIMISSLLSPPFKLCHLSPSALFYGYANNVGICSKGEGFHQFVAGL